MFFEKKTGIELTTHSDTYEMAVDGVSVIFNYFYEIEGVRSKLQTKPIFGQKGYTPRDFTSEKNIWDFFENAILWIVFIESIRKNDSILEIWGRWISARNLLEISKNLFD